MEPPFFCNCCIYIYVYIQVARAAESFGKREGSKSTAGEGGSEIKMDKISFKTLEYLKKEPCNSKKKNNSITLEYFETRTKARSCLRSPALLGTQSCLQISGEIKNNKKYEKKTMQNFK